MILDNEIYVQRKITERTRLLFILNSIRRNIKSYDKKENEKRNTTSHRD